MTGSAGTFLDWGILGKLVIPQTPTDAISTETQIVSPYICYIQHQGDVVVKAEHRNKGWMGNQGH